MIIKIVRYRKKAETIDGQLYIEGMRICDCAENAMSAIKAVQYLVNICKCKQYARKMPIIMLPACDGSKVPMIHGSNAICETLKPWNSETLEQKCLNCKKLELVSNNTTLPVRCPMLKPGNGIHNRKDGSIIVGEFLVPGCLIHPKQAFDNLYERLRKSAQRGHEIRLTIVEDYMINPNGTLDLGTRALASIGGRKVACEQ